MQKPIAAGSFATDRRWCVTATLNRFWSLHWTNCPDMKFHTFDIDSEAKLGRLKGLLSEFTG
ncbi:hypothetical protein [Haloferax sp. DFSO52]|uniref:hypothetical protein n=1 Tax=Haloferax sp. DFSO52 TaxID=3388505 RepID=UPI003A8BCDB2